MTAEQAFRLATRALAIFFLFWVVADVFNFIEDVVPLVHHMHALRSRQGAFDMSSPASFIAEEHYYIRYYALRAALQALLMLLWLWAARALVRGSSRVRDFFLPPSVFSDQGSGSVP